MLAHHREALIKHISGCLTDLGVMRHDAEQIAHKFCRVYGATANQVIADFIANGWSITEMHDWYKNEYTIRRKDGDWHVGYARLFEIEKMLIRAGLTEKSSRKILIRQPWIYYKTPEELENNIRSLMSYGFDDRRIYGLLDKMPKIFYFSSDELITACHLANRERRGLLWNPNASLPPEKNITETLPTSKSDPPSKTTKKDEAEWLSGHVSADSAAILSQRRSRRVFLDDEADDKNQNLMDSHKLRMLIEAMHDDDPDAWNKFIMANSWLKDPTSVQFIACAAIQRWVPFTTASRILEFYSRLLYDKASSALLALSKQALDQRMFVLRRIEREFESNVSLLYLPFETIEPDELRYRINEIESHGWQAGRKPFLAMLLAASRADFLQQISDRQSRHNQKKSFLLRNPEPSHNFELDQDMEEKFTGDLVSHDEKPPSNPRGRIMNPKEVRNRLINDRAARNKL